MKKIFRILLLITSLLIYWESEIMQEMLMKEQKLVEKLRQLKKVAIAYSGGIDSTYLLKIALETLGEDNVLAVIVNSELFSDEEFNLAIDLADKMGAQVLGLEMNELSNPKIAANTPKSWYYSKQLLYQTIKSHVNKNSYVYVLDGMIMDDQADFRPGLKARDEEGVQSLLQQVGLYKEEIRLLAQKHNLSNWNKVASCSLASRFPYGTRLTYDAVQRVFASEKYLRDELGFKTVRVRVHQDLARIELPEKDLTNAWLKRAIISEKLHALGFEYVTFDVEAFRSGRMNEALHKHIGNQSA